MQRRRITLSDGRYLIFYTFEEEDAREAQGSMKALEKTSEPEAEPQAEEEQRRV
jgi:hypothetical protein